MANRARRIRLVVICVLLAGIGVTTWLNFRLLTRGTPISQESAVDSRTYGSMETASSSPSETASLLDAEADNPPSVVGEKLDHPPAHIEPPEASKLIERFQRPGKHGAAQVSVRRLPSTNLDETEAYYRQAVERRGFTKLTAQRDGRSVTLIGRGSASEDGRTVVIRLVRKSKGLVITTWFRMTGNSR